MPFLPFEAVDSTGKTIKGTLQANSVQDLEMMLLQRGLRMVNPGSSSTMPQIPAQPRVPMQQARPVQQVRPVQQPRPIERPTISPGGVTAAATVMATTTAASAKLKTPELSKRELFFLFTQFSSFMKSGFSVSQMIHHTTSKAPPKVRAMFEEMETEAAGGMALSESMAKRPITFTPDIVATVKAGEQSGKMNEAFDVLVEQLDRGKAFNRSLGYFYLMSPILILCGIGGMSIQKASTSTIKRQFDADGQLSQVGTLAEEIRKQLPHDFLRAVIVAALFVVGIIVWQKYPFRRVRHQLGLMVPIGHGRAVSEAVERFTWSMSTMLKGGASPASSVHTAAESIPNMVLRQRALDALGNGTRENEPLGSVLQRTGLLSPEYVHIAQNGELTGDTPGALDSIMRAEASQVHTKSGGLNVIIVIITTVVMGLFTAIMLAILYKMYAEGLIKMILAQ